MKRFTAALSMVFASLAAHADSVGTLREFIRDVKTGRAQFKIGRAHV